MARNVAFANRAKATSVGFDRTGVKHTDAAKYKISLAKQGRTCSEETRQKMSEAKQGSNNPSFGKACSEETKQKISAALAGSNNPMFGKTPSEETRQKMSAAKQGSNHPMFGQAHSEETKRKISAALSGMRRSNETKQKISAASFMEPQTTDNIPALIFEANGYGIRKTDASIYIGCRA